MIDIQVDESIVKKLYLQKLEEKLKEVELELVYWDRKELERRTCMSWTAIQERFFFDERFPKHKIGNKWYFPAKKAQAFLLEWLEEQSY